LAVTADGVHVLAYLGQGQWIQADPGVHRVIIEHATTSRSSWFDARVKVRRWKVLDSGAPDPIGETGRGNSGLFSKNCG
jgi:hypothetical protein